MKIIDIDRKYIWHPFTQEKYSPTPTPIIRAKDSYLYDENGKGYLDLISSWWVNVHGHANNYIAEKIYEQAKKLEHVIFAGFTHDAATKMIVKLANFMPEELGKYFFSDNGSTSVEIALKMCYQYWRNQGNHNRYRFIAFQGGYHGDTVGSMSLGHSSGFFNIFADLLFKADFMPYPYSWDGDEEIEHKENHAITLLSEYLERNNQEVAAMIIEPLVQGASGMRMMRANFLEKIVKLVQSYGILVIFDEVMTGFGRSGKMFAFEHTNIIPDVICLSKGLTGGFLPLSLTVTTQEIYNRFLDDDFMKGFMHGHSYTANPLGCAAALACLELFEQNNTINQLSIIECWHKKYLYELKDKVKLISQVRICGTISAFKVNTTQQGYTTKIGSIIKDLAWEEGLLIRPLGDQVYLLPPYCITQEQLEYSYKQIAEIIPKALKLVE